MKCCGAGGAYKEGVDAAVITAAFEKHLREVYAWLDGRSYVKALRVSYHDVLSKPKDVAAQVAEFVQAGLDVEAMAQQVDAALYRNRAK